MEKRGMTAGLLFFAAALCLADVQAVMETTDRLYEEGQYQRARGLLESSLAQAAGGAERAELGWRLARAWLKLGDQAEDRGADEKELLGYFERGEAEAQKAIDADARNHLGYYWKAVNVGRWGQVRGIFKALAKAKTMRDLLHQALLAEPDHADSYYVLGQLYEQVPSGLSFGDKDYAVSLGRRAVDLRERQVEEGQEEEINYDFYTELAKHLWARNSSSSRRLREQRKIAGKYASIADPMEKNFYYEAAVTLGDMSDRDEALQLVKRVVRELERLPGRTSVQNDDLQEAGELLESWK